jgi:hypothetical protein
MPMPPYPVLCYGPGCGRPARYKVAARWSDGVTQELKTYGLTCADCLPEWFRRGRARHAACRRAPGEVLDPPGIFEMAHGCRDRALVRRPDLEEQHTASG